jgi:hypothetical protein
VAAGAVERVAAAFALGLGLALFLAFESLLTPKNSSSNSDSSTKGVALSAPDLYLLFLKPKHHTTYQCRRVRRAGGAQRLRAYAAAVSAAL